MGVMCGIRALHVMGCLGLTTYTTEWAPRASLTAFQVDPVGGVSARCCRADRRSRTHFLERSNSIAGNNALPNSPCQLAGLIEAALFQNNNVCE